MLVLIGAVLSQPAVGKVQAGGSDSPEREARADGPPWPRFSAGRFARMSLRAKMDLLIDAARWRESQLQNFSCSLTRQRRNRRISNQTTAARLAAC